LSYILIAFGIILASFLPEAQNTAKKYYQSQVSEFVTLLFESSKDEFLKAYAFGIRILGLLAGWFVLLFVLESILALALRALGWILKRIFRKSESQILKPASVSE